MQETQETQVQSLGQENPWRRKWQPTPVSLPADFHRQGSLAGYNPWGHKELDVTEDITQGPLWSGPARSSISAPCLPVSPRSATPAFFVRASQSLQILYPGLETSKNFSPFSTFGNTVQILLQFKLLPLLCFI